MLSENLQKIAVALKYKYLEDTQPMVVASGVGTQAQSIIKKAVEHDVPLHKEPNLAVLLRKVGVGQPIPEELFEVVAEIIALVYRLDARNKGAL